jgi:hypothetical protein
MMVITWVNDEKIQRAYDAKTDVYKVFESMLNAGDLLDDGDRLLTEAKRIG